MTQGSHGGAVPRSREKGSKEEVDEQSRQAGSLKRRFERPRASTQLTFAEGSIIKTMSMNHTLKFPSSIFFQVTITLISIAANRLIKSTGKLHH